MSLNVYLVAPETTVVKPAGRIFIRENGQTREISRSEWNDKFPNTEPAVTLEESASNKVFSANITHNLNVMANEAGIYQHLWRPEEIGITRAAEIIQPLKEGLTVMLSDPLRFKKHNPSNGWGSYEVFIAWLEKYIAACEEHPEALVSVSR